MSFTLFMSIAATIVTGIFTFLVFRRWRANPKPHLMAWSIGLLMYFLGTLSQVVLYFVWSPLFFGIWYWCGALMVAAWLGQGSIYLLVRRGNIARNVQMALILVAIMTFPWVMFATPFNANAWFPGADMTIVFKAECAPDENGVLQVVREGVFAACNSRGTVRFFSPIMNAWGTLALVGGAIYSAVLFRRKEIMRNRMVGNLFIATGGIFPAFSGALISLGDPSYKYFGEMAGAILIFIGFMLASSAKDEMMQTAQAKREARAVTSGG
ncbi:MAG: hypothetical protein MUC99_01765 [Anaerolineae bacterium]|jgi:hypothetical protein|nr:hypothetical protein [Anaerolineae bacterium]